MLPVKNARQEVVEVLLVLSDVTARVKAQSARLESDRHLPTSPARLSVPVAAPLPG